MKESVWKSVHATLKSTKTYVLSKLKEESRRTQPLNALTIVLQEGSINIVVDLGEVGYISSAGLRVFLSTLKSVKAKSGILVLANLHSNVAKVFKLAGFTKIFTIMDDVASAVESMV